LGTQTEANAQGLSMKTFTGSIVAIG
jgi:hypothetical protein